MGCWEKVRLSEILSPYRVEHLIQDNISYRQVTISKSGSIGLRGNKLGSKIGRKRQFLIDLKSHPNTLIFTRQGLAEGAIGIVPEHLDGCVVTENMPPLSIDTHAVRVEYIRKLIRSEYFFEKINKLKVVGSAQKSIHERDLLKIEINIPPILVQDEQCVKFKALDNEHDQLKSEITHQQALLKKLRQQILQEAIEGKLTADWRKQNPNIEPASTLLERIQVEKEQLIEAGKMKRQKSLSPIGEEEKPFELPEGWEWCRLESVSNAIHYGATKSAKSNKAGVRLLRITDIQNNAVNWNNVPGCDYSENDVANYGLSENDILIARTGGTIGKTFLVKNISVQSLFASYLIRVIPNMHINAEYLKLFLESPFYWKQLYDAAWGAGQPNVNGTSLKKLHVPLPTLSEQKAIVVSVNTLLTFCDQLETQITQNQTYATALMQTVLREAFAHGTVPTA